MFACNVLTDEKLKKYISKKAFKKFLKIKETKQSLDLSLAQKIAKAIKKWAISMGATHYTHWFFPLHGKSAGKEVSFLDFDNFGNSINVFNENCLIKGETDASSFPSGGERLTFEARGYTVWDYSSPIFIKEDFNKNKILYIPTALCSYTGLALDEKTSLLRAMDFMNTQSKKILQLLNYKVKSVGCKSGMEQEFFLIDKEVFNQRIDMVSCFRTLFFDDTVKNQKDFGHYFCKIDSKISAFMHDLDRELWKVGILAKIQHNEVAPLQHEIVAVYRDANIATDQNMLLMDIMQNVANKHNLQVVFHEKPFYKLNGSGKHNNWSISTDEGLNLLDYNCCEQNVFMLFFTAVISAIDKHYDLLKASVSSYTNDLRLGGYEAPPSIISVYVGKDMLERINNFINDIPNKKTKRALDLKAFGIAKTVSDNCDRNRTSPFAFTENKFEFRMLGASQNPTLCNCVLATIVGSELKEMYEFLKASVNVNQAIKEIVAKKIKKHERIIFNGNCYSKNWEEEAKRRGLVSQSCCIDSFKCLLDSKNVKLLKDNNIMSENEIIIKYNIFVNDYCDKALVEARTMRKMSMKYIIPKLEDYLLYFMKYITKKQSLKLDTEKELKYIFEMNEKIELLKKQTHFLCEKIQKIEKIENQETKALEIKNVLINCMNDLRYMYFDVEKFLPKKFQPFITYDDIFASYT